MLGKRLIDTYFRPPNVATNAEYLVVAGGGGLQTRAGYTGTYGGGGAGGYRSSVVGQPSGGGASAESLFALQPSTSYTVIVGAGGAYKGGDSSFYTITSEGGGQGKTNFNENGDGGSGGGAAAVYAGGLGTANQGFNGGCCGCTSTPSGGGGAASVGENGCTDGTYYGGDGGLVLTSSITGTAVLYSTGAGAPGRASGQPGVPSTAGPANTGQGGYPQTTGGGSGIVVIRYTSPTILGIGGDSIVQSGGKVSHIFTSSGTFIW